MNSASSTAARPLSIGNEFTFDPVRGELFGKDGTTRPLRPKAYKLLAYLVQRPHCVVDRAELTRVIWPGVHVTEDSLSHLVREIRRALADADGSVLQTVPGRGYRFAVNVENLEPPETVQLAANSAIPQNVTSFIGRRRELEELHELTKSHRLLTITGMGGIGKTRLLQQLAAESLSGLGGRLCWIDLTSTLTLDDVGLAISSRLNVGMPFGAVDQAIATVLRHRNLLLLVDNAEHVADPLRLVVQTILAECRDVSLVLTSRISLGIPGERVYRLDPLPLPAPGSCSTVERAMRFDSVKLFVDRVQLLVPSFRLADAKPEIVGEICRKLDGIALAIEMAVPRLQVLTAEQFLQRLDQRFNLLTSRDNAGPARQRSLRHMLEWSWELLWEPDRSLLTVLGVFTGTVSLSAIVAMRSVEQFAEWAVLEGLTELVRASMVVAEAVAAEPRYRLLETTRAFALEQLSPAALQALRRQHLAVMAAIFEAAELEWRTANSVAWLGRFAPDADNVRAALNWGFGAGGEPELALRLVAASYPLWWELPNLPLRESWQWFDLAVSRIGPGTAPHVQARLWLGHSWRDITAGDSQNTASAQRAVDLLRERVDDPVLLGAALWRLACSKILPATYREAGRIMDEAIGLLRAAPATKWLALALVRRGNIHANQEENQRALPFYNEAFALAERSSHWQVLQHAGSSLAELMFSTGAREEGIALLQRLRREISGLVKLPMLSILSTHLAADDQHEAALEAIGEVLDGAFEAGLSTALARTMETLAMLTAVAGKARPAARLLGYVLTLHPVSRRRKGGRLAVFDRLDGLLRAELPAALLEDLCHEGAKWTELEATEAARAQYGWLAEALPE